MGIPKETVKEFKDSGTRQDFATGAVRDAASNKGMFNLIPFWPMYAYAAVLEAGTMKYSARNWQKGMPIGRYIDSALRHLMKYQSGFRDEPHLWMAMWNIAGAIHTQVNTWIGLYPEEFNDMTDDAGSSQCLLSDFEEERIRDVMGMDKIDSDKRIISVGEIIEYDPRNSRPGTNNCS